MILDHEGFEKTHAEVSEIFRKAKSERQGIAVGAMGEDEPYLVWSGIIRHYVASLANIYNISPDEKSIPTDLIDVIRYSAYSINDKNIFEDSPKNEREIHLRIESIIRCIYPDMLHEPSLAKPIKNFKPDTGIPSIKTLIEYKFITSQNDAKRVADEILADMMGYHSKEWNKFLFVVYETNRIKHEKEWKQLIHACKANEGTEIIVLSGEPGGLSKERGTD